MPRACMRAKLTAAIMNIKKLAGTTAAAGSAATSAVRAFFPPSGLAAKKSVPLPIPRPVNR